MKNNILDYSWDELKEALVLLGLPAYAARQVFSWIYQKNMIGFDKMSDLSKTSRIVLRDNFVLLGLDLVKEEISCDGTKKFLWQLSDNARIESALIPNGGRLTLCVSSQVGCKFKCAFCVSGSNGFHRNLTQGEIVGQYLEVQKITEQKITNIVFMGTGEPLDNLNNVARSVCILTDTKAVAIPKRKICISTCGLVPEIYELAKLQLGIKLSLSLHAAKDNLRDQIMPINKKYPIKDVMKALGFFAGSQKLPIMFEYILLKGFNSAPMHARDLIRLLKGIDCKVNLIPCNESVLGFKGVSDEQAKEFAKLVQDDGVFCTVQIKRPGYIRCLRSAAC